MKRISFCRLCNRITIVIIIPQIATPIHPISNTFNALSQWGKLSWISSNNIPPSPLRSCCFRSLSKDFLSLILYIALKENRPSGDTSIFGLLTRDSDKSHCFTWRMEARWSQIQLAGREGRGISPWSQRRADSSHLEFRRESTGGRLRPGVGISCA